MTLGGCSRRDDSIAPWVARHSLPQPCIRFAHSEVSTMRRTTEDALQLLTPARMASANNGALPTIDSSKFNHDCPPPDVRKRYTPSRHRSDGQNTNTQVREVSEVDRSRPN
jgi:hypothetical protein